MRILKVAGITNSRNSGMGRVMHSTADEMRLMGHTVDMLFSEDVPRFRRGASDRFVFPVALVRAVRAAIRERGQYDVVEIHEPSAAWYCHVRRYDKSLPPCVVMSHGSEQNYWNHLVNLDLCLGRRTSLKRRISVSLTLLSQVKYSLQHCQQVMCLNSQDEDFFRTKSHISSIKLSRIQHGVESHFFQSKQTVPNTQPRLLFVGSWLDNKGRTVIPKVFERLYKQYPGLQMSLLGTGLSVPAVLDSFDLALQPAITVHPRVNDNELLAAYAEHDIMVLPSFFESWGLVLLEAAAAQVAIVSSTAGGPSELFRDGENAFLVPALDIQAITAAISKLIDDPQLRFQLGRKAQERARQFTWSAAAQSQLNAYECAMENANVNLNEARS